MARVCERDIFFVPAPGFFGDLLSLVCQSFSMVDMVLLLHGQHQPLSRIQPQLTRFFTEQYLHGGEPSDANIAVRTAPVVALLAGLPLSRPPRRAPLVAPPTGLIHLLFPSSSLLSLSSCCHLTALPYLHIISCRHPVLLNLAVSLSCHPSCSLLLCPSVSTFLRLLNTADSHAVLCKHTGPAGIIPALKGPAHSQCHSQVHQRVIHASVCPQSAAEDLINGLEQYIAESFVSKTIKKKKKKNPQGLFS